MASGFNPFIFFRVCMESLLLSKKVFAQISSVDISFLTGGEIIGPDGKPFPAGRGKQTFGGTSVCRGARIPKELHQFFLENGFAGISRTASVSLIHGGLKTRQSRSCKWSGLRVMSAIFSSFQAAFPGIGCRLRSRPGEPGDRRNPFLRVPCRTHLIASSRAFLEEAGQ